MMAVQRALPPDYGGIERLLETLLFLIAQLDLLEKQKGLVTEICQHGELLIFSIVRPINLRNYENWYVSLLNLFIYIL